MNPFGEATGKAFEIAGEVIERRHLSQVMKGEEELGHRDITYVYNHIDKWGDNDGDVDFDDVIDIAKDVINFFTGG